jgi:hypothetical protein
MKYLAMFTLIFTALPVHACGLRKGLNLLTIINTPSTPVLLVLLFIFLVSLFCLKIKSLSTHLEMHRKTLRKISIFSFVAGIFLVLVWLLLNLVASTTCGGGMCLGSAESVSIFGHQYPARHFELLVQILLWIFIVAYLVSAFLFAKCLSLSVRDGLKFKEKNRPVIWSFAIVVLIGLGVLLGRHYLIDSAEYKCAAFQFNVPATKI